MDKPSIWFRFYKTIKNDVKLRFRWEKLPDYRFDEFIDFKMKYYVSYESTHIMAGICKNPQAIAEYREILSILYKNPSYHNSICCVDDETNKIVGFDSLKLYESGEIYNEFWPAKTAEVKLYYKITQGMDKICPVPDILKRYGVNKVFDDAGLAIHPKYRGYQFTAEVALLRSIVSKANGVPLTGAWMTSSAVQQRTKMDGWDTIKEVSSEQLEQILVIKTENVPQMFVYKVKKVV